MAQWHAQADDPATLRCPLCHHGQCAACVPGGWTPLHDARLAALCEAEGVPQPARLPCSRTTQVEVRDYTVRTFTCQDALEPPAPIHITVHCCHRVGAVRDHGAVSFVDLPGREANWSPLPLRHGEGIAAWTPSWSCMRCGQQIRQDAIALPDEAGSACAVCGRLRHWHYDATAGAGSLTCSCPPPAPPHTAAVDIPSTPWAHRLPPTDPITTDRNSFLYVPLLHAAAGNLAAPALAAWQASGPAAGWWDQARRLLRDAGPLPSQPFLDFFATAGAPGLADMLRLALQTLPQGTQLRLGWVLRLFTAADGYVPPACQEACLQLYGGYRLASELDAFSNRFRARAAPSTPPPAFPSISAPAPTPAAPPTEPLPEVCG